MREEFHQPFHVKVFDGNEVVFADVVRRKLVEEVSALALQLGVTLSFCALLLAVIHRLVFFP